MRDVLRKREGDRRRHARMKARRISTETVPALAGPVGAVAFNPATGGLFAATSGPGLTAQLIGCSIPELMAHLEKQFLPDMTWENRSHWHIDHKRPCASFDLTDPQQQRICFHYTNLRPLWAVDNIRKSAKVI